MWKRKMFFKIALIVPVFIAAISAAVMLLWNALIPELFHGPVLNYWQALGLLVLSHILFGRHSGHNWRQHMWHRRLHEKMTGMTPEEKEAFFKCWHPHSFGKDGAGA